ncbi:MAG: AAA family ATPase, partial [Cyclobacteriaceae bacterium]
IELYNADDCFATLALHQWVETIFQDQLKNEHPLERPELLSGDANEKVSEDDERARVLYEGLVAGLSDDPDNWTEEEKAKWLLAHQIQFYRRELKSAIWEFYRLNDLEPSELLTERKGVFGLVFKETVEASKMGIPTDRYTYPAQEISLEIGKELWEPKAKSAVGKINYFSLEDRTVDIKKTRNTAEIHPFAVHTREVVSPGVLVPSLYTFAEEIIQSGVHGDGLYRAGRDLLVKNPPRLKSEDTFGLKDGETIESGSLRLAKDLDQSILPIQGPPGTGKTYIGAGLIAELVKEGKKVGVTAVSHKVIRGLLDRTKARANEKGIDLAIKHKPKSGTPISKDDLVLIKDKNAAIANLQAGAVVGGTSWLWADDDFEGQLDYLFVDEAGQMSLTNVLTISRATKNLVLLGDPQQLEQPKKGAHPEGADISALEHLLDGKQTIAKDRGLFLDTTWRLNPNITAFTSKLYYDGRLISREGLEVQVIKGQTR